MAVFPIGLIVVAILAAILSILNGEKGNMNTLITTDQNIVISGKVVNFGSPGSIELHISSDGRFLQIIDAEIPETLAFDGSRAWTTDGTGFIRTLSDVELAWYQLRCAVIANNWEFVEHEFELEFKSDESTSELEVLRVTHATAPMEAVITRERQSKRAHSFQLEGGMFQDSIQLKNYKEENGALVPTRLEHAVDDFGFRTVDFDQQQSVEGFSSAIFTPDDKVRDDFAFDASISPEIEIMKTAMGHFLVRPIINGVQMGWFFLDTGASASAIARHAAPKLELRQIGQFPILSIFGREETPVYKADSLTLGPITIENPVFAEMDLLPINEALGIEIEGVIGFPLFARSIVEVDASADRVFIHDPANFTGENIEWDDLILDFNHPVIPATFEGGQKALFRFDIGAGQINVIFHTHLVDRLNMIEDREVEEQDIGVGVVAFGQLDWIEVAGQRFEDVLAGFSRATEGPFADVNTAGNIGVGLLGSYKLVFDYQNARLAFVDAD